MSITFRMKLKIAAQELSVLAMPNLHSSLDEQSPIKFCLKVASTAKR